MTSGDMSYTAILWQNQPEVKHGMRLSVSSVPSVVKYEINHRGHSGCREAAYPRPRNWMMCRRSRFDGRPSGRISNSRIAFRSAAAFWRSSRLSSVSR